MFSFGLDLTKLFSDVDAETAAETKLYDSVKFKIQNKTDDTWIVAKRNDAEGIYYVTGHTDKKADATVFTPVTMGKSYGHIMVKGLEEDTYTITETQTANGYTLLKNAITVTIAVKENTSNTCNVYAKDVLGVLQNDPHYSFDGGEDLKLANIPQRALSHNYPTASATVDKNEVTMLEDNGSANAEVPLTVKNTKGFDLPKTGDQSRKDDVITFEELGVDRIFVDEAHMFKNLAAFTKMRNVAGISQTEAQKSSDLYMKCRYLDELTGGRGVVFATGTPISNSMVELYTMQKYLQYSTLKEKGLLHFDAWASTFGETVTAIELAPEGTGYRAKTRFAKFFNLPELMSMFKEIADIQTADMLKLPVPEAEYHNVVLKPSEQQKEIVASLSERAEKVRNKQVDSNVDNMLVITNDGRKLALDQRLINPLLPDSDTGKVAVCAENVYEIWSRTAENKSTQIKN